MLTSFGSLCIQAISKTALECADHSEVKNWTKHLKDIKLPPMLATSQTPTQHCEIQNYA